jgi:hypothetical protein
MARGMAVVNIDDIAKPCTSPVAAYISVDKETLIGNNDLDATRDFSISKSVGDLTAEESRQSLRSVASCALVRLHDHFNLLAKQSQVMLDTRTTAYFW